MCDLLRVHVLHAFDDLHEQLTRIVLAKIAVLLQPTEQLPALTETNSNHNYSCTRYKFFSSSNVSYKRIIIGWSILRIISISFCNDSGFFTIFFAINFTALKVLGGSFSLPLYTIP